MATKSEKARRKRRYSNAKETMTAAEEGYRPTAFKVPEGMSVFRFSEEKVYRIDIIPFPAGKGNPRADEGCDHFERTFYVHRNLGPNQDSHCCLAKNFNKSCPVCEHRQRISNDPDGDTELADKLKPQWRHLWLVYDYEEPDKGIQLMDTAHYKSFGELLSNKVRAGDEDDNFENFHHLEDGMTLKVACEEDSFNGRTYFKPTNIEMKPRKTPLDSELTDEVPCLDELLIELSYKKLKELLLAEPAEDEDKEDEDEDSETSEDEDEEEEKKPAKKPGKKTGKKPAKPADDDEEDEVEDEDADEEDEDGPSEDEDEEEEEEKVKFKKGDNVKGEYRDKTFTGKVIAIKNGLIHVETLKGNLRVMSPGDLKLVSRPEAEDEEGEEEKPKPKKTGKPSKPTSKKPSKKDEEEEEDDEDIWDEDYDEEEESEDEDETEDEDED